MKVLIIGTRFLSIPSVDGGAIEKLLDEYIKHNSETKKADIVVYSAEPSDLKKVSIVNNNVSYRFIDRKQFFYKILHLFLGIIRKLFNLQIHDEFAYFVYKDLIKKHEIDYFDKIIILNNINNVLYFSKKIKGKHILYLHNDYLNINSKNGEKIIDSVDEIWCVSKFIKNRVDEVKISDKSIVLYNGVDISIFDKHTSNSRIKQLKEQFDIGDDDFIILYTGRLIKIKGVLELIESFIGFSKDKNAKLFIVGNTNKHEKDYCKRLKTLGKENKNIYFLGYRNHEFISDFSKLVDVQVVPSIGNEAFGLTVVEGLASGNIMIVSDAGGIPEIVNDKCAIIVNHQNLFTELTSAMNKVYTLSVKEKKNMKKAAMSIAQNFSVFKFNQNLEKKILK